MNKYEQARLEGFEEGQVLKRIYEVQKEQEWDVILSPELRRKLYSGEVKPPITQHIRRTGKVE